MSFRFRMLLADGEDLDDYTSSEPNWSTRRRRLRGKDGPPYRITAVIPVNSLDNEVYAGIWEVEPIGAGAHVGSEVL